MNNTWLYTLISVSLVSIISLIGVITLSMNNEKLKNFLIYLISFSAGALFGDAFLHLLPGAVEENGFRLSISISILSGILIFFILEKIIHWRHCHVYDAKNHVHPFAYTNLVGDALHNFIDGLIIAASYLVSIPVGIATTIAVILHEIPQEIGDFSVLIHAGFSKGRALFMNFLTAITAILGALAGLWLAGEVEGVTFILIPVAAGGFIYIAGSDLIPELHKHSANFKKSVLQFVMFVIGILIMAALLLLE